MLLQRILGGKNGQPMKNRQPKPTPKSQILRIPTKRILDTEELRKAISLKEYADRGMARFKRLMTERVKKAVVRSAKKGQPATTGFTDTRVEMGTTTQPVFPYDYTDPLERFSTFVVHAGDGGEGCGIGPGGFQPGNTCASGGGGSPVPRKIGYIEQVDPGDVKAGAFKSPYKMLLGARLNIVADWLSRNAGDGGNFEKAATAAHDAVKRRTDALSRWAIDYHGDEVKELDSYRAFRKAAEKARNSVYDAFANSNPSDSDGIVVLKGEVTRTAQDVGIAFMRMRDEIDAKWSAEIDMHWITPPLSEKDRTFFPGEGDIRDSEHLWADGHESSLPDPIKPIKFTDPGTVSLRGKPLTSQQRKAVSSYADKGYRAVNDMLRGANDPTPKAQKTHGHLQSLFKGLEPSPIPVTVYRGLSLNAQQTVRLLGQLKAAHGSGELIHFAGYSSTTFDPAVAFAYGEGGKDKRPGGSGNDVVFEIAARKGLNLGDLTNDDPSGNLSEQELLLDHDSAFRVAGIRSIVFKHPETGALEERTVVQLIHEVR